jgi:phenylalanine-4-hydroxylase
VRFDLARVMQTDYRIDDFQETYFVIPSMDALLELACTDFDPLYQAVRDLPALHPGAILPDDVLVSRGSGSYHRNRRGEN